MDTSNALVVPEKLSELQKTAPVILEENSGRVQRAIDYGQSLVTLLEKGIDEKGYNDGLEYLSKVRKTITLMNESRKPVTQFLAEISKQFTQLESRLDIKSPDTIPWIVQKLLDDHAAKVAKEKREREAEQEKIREYEMQKIRYKSEVETFLNTEFLAYLRECIQSLNEFWNSVTLENFDETKAEILKNDLEYRIQILENASARFYSKTLLIPADSLAIKNSVVKEKFPDFQKQFNDAFIKRTQEIEDQFDYRFAELTAIAQAGKEEAERLQKEAEERAEQQRLQSEAELNKRGEDIQTETEITKSSDTLNTLFDAVPATPEIKVKELTEVKVLNPAGWMALMVFYFEKEGKNLDSEKLEKKFGFMRKFAETYYMKNDEKVSSPYLRYEATAKAK